MHECIWSAHGFEDSPFTEFQLSSSLKDNPLGIKMYLDRLIGLNLIFLVYRKTLLSTCKESHGINDWLLKSAVSKQTFFIIQFDKDSQTWRRRFLGFLIWQRVSLKI